ncbi:cathelicidin-B1-like [Opisthocomus hoazin]|uniref:cathelicidin-B1-like n=1 Tax=Opisthocomus hoazin TaxID=30419 RepID=UPI003F537CF8
MMGPCRAVLLLLLLGLTRATTPRPGESTPKMTASVPPTASPRWALSYGDAVVAAVELLNARAVAPYVLRLRDALSRPGWPGDLQSRQELSFTVEETWCRTPATATTACKTRWPGVLRWCQGFVFLEQQQPTVELSCEMVPGTFGRVGTSRLGDFFARIKERLRGFFQCGRIWIRDRLNLGKAKP